MFKVLISLTDQLASRMKITIPERQRNKVITLLLETEITKRENALYECALEVENDIAIKTDMAAWNNNQ